MPATYYHGFPESLLRVVLHEPATPAVPEAMVHDIWQHQRFRNNRLQTVGDVPVSIIDPGRLNSDQGPDFLNAKLRLGSTVWTGSVEIHVSSGIWLDHGHDRDERYNSTLLHVVLYNDIWTGKLRRADGTLLPELVLYPYIEAPLRQLIQSFYVRPDDRLLCASGWNRVRTSVRDTYLLELCQERMAGKARRFGVQAEDASRSATLLEQAIYEGLFSGLGYAKNSASMRVLATICPLNRVRSLSEQRDVEALFFGAAGLLPRPADLLDADRSTSDYVVDLRDRFERMNHQFGIEPMSPTAWRFFRLRPANFPTLRIAQGAALFRRPDGLLARSPLSRLGSAVRDQHPVRALRVLFAVELDPFWRDHVRLEKRSAAHTTSIGRSRIDGLIVNTILPALFAAKELKPEELAELLSRIPATDDEVTRRFATLGSPPVSAAQSQAYHQLFTTRCAEARCLSCTIGREVLRTDDA